MALRKDSKGDDSHCFREHEDDHEREESLVLLHAELSCGLWCFEGSKEKTYTARILKLSKSGTLITKKSSAAVRKRWEGSQSQQWIKGVVAARKELNISGFVALLP